MPECITRANGVDHVKVPTALDEVIEQAAGNSLAAVVSILWKPDTEHRLARQRILVKARYYIVQVAIRVSNSLDRINPVLGLKDAPRSSTSKPWPVTLCV